MLEGGKSSVWTCHALTLLTSPSLAEMVTILPDMLWPSVMSFFWDLAQPPRNPSLHCWVGLCVLLVTRCYHTAASFCFLIFLTYQTGLHFQLIWLFGALSKTLAHERKLQQNLTYVLQEGLKRTFVFAQNCTSALCSLRLFPSVIFEHF